MTIKVTFCGSVFWIVVIARSVKTVAGQRCPDGRNLINYNGNVSVTDGGRPCQKWTSHEPHRHPFMSVHFLPSDVSVEAAENYCRSVGKRTVPWCYTEDPHVQWQYCYWQICQNQHATCGGELKSSSGLITGISSDYGNVYDRRTDCLWVLVVPDSMMIEYQVSHTVLGGTNCGLQNIRIYARKGFISLICNNHVSNLRKLLTKKLYVRFYNSGDDNATSSFNLTYRHFPFSPMNFSTTPLSSSSLRPTIEGSTMASTVVYGDSIWPVNIPIVAEKITTGIETTGTAVTTGLTRTDSTTADRINGSATLTDTSKTFFLLSLSLFSRIWGL